MFDFSQYDELFKFCITAYIPVVFGLKYFVETFLSDQSKKYLSNSLEIPFSLWCFGLSIFSCFGTYYTGKYLLEGYPNVRVTEGDAAFWFDAFIISKIPELIDTIFIVLRSKKLVALQWYHHWATLTICYNLSSLSCNEFTPFFFTNYFVHSFMYLYFGLYPFLGRSISSFGTFVNFIQTLQMFLATGLAIYIYNSGVPLRCNHVPETSELNYLFGFGTLMYISYFILFVSLFFERQIRLSKEKTT